VLGVTGEVLITAGVLVLLFLGWQIWWNNVVTAGQQTTAAAQQSQKWIDDALKAPKPAPDTSTAQVDPPVMAKPAPYQPFAVIYVPRLGADWKRTIRQTVDVERVLNSYTAGVGHYIDTQLPGQVGNFAVAGHRVGKGEPFLNIDKLRSGDAVIVETRTYWYVYRVLGSPAGQDPGRVHESIPVAGRRSVTLPGREIVDPSAGRVLDEVPDNPGVRAATALMTMTTCHPKFTASHRMIVYSKLAGAPVKNVGLKMPASVLALYDEVKA